MHWPLPLAPHEDELLSSFLVRVAHRHGLSPYRFCAFHFPGVPVWNRDIDRSASNEFLEAVATKAGLSLERVVQMTLCSVGARLGQGAARGPAPWINTVGIYHRLRRRCGLQYCPDCMAEIPVFYRAWRMSFVVVCNRHRRLLQDACPHCGMPLAIHRQIISAQLCHRCSQVLGRIQQDPDLSVAALLQAQLYFERAMRSGSVEIGGQPVSSEDLFQGARILASLMVSTPRVLQGAPQHQRLSLERARVQTRARILLRLADVLGIWPLEFTRAAGEQHLTQRSFIRKSVPPWLASAVDELSLGRTRHAIAPRRRHSLRAKLEKNRRCNADWRTTRAALLWLAASK